MYPVTETSIAYTNVSLIIGKLTLVVTDHSVRASQTDGPPNSEVNGGLLSVCAGSVYAVEDISGCFLRDSNGNYGKIPYSTIPLRFSLEGLYVADHDVCQPAWRSLMVYMGVPTFDPEDPSKFLKISNHISRARLGKDVIAFHKLKGHIAATLADLSRNGEAGGVPPAFQEIMQQTIRSPRDFKLTEADYRDRLN